MINKLRNICLENFDKQNFDRLAFGVLDFKSHTFETFEIHEGHEVDSGLCLFDLASLTKALTLGFSFAKFRSDIDHKILSLIEHRAGLPAFGRLSKKDWKEQILNYKIIEDTQTVYSDYSALRAMLELEKKWGTSLYEKVSPLWSKGLIHWSDITDWTDCPITGWRQGKVIQGDVNDDNAFIIKEKLTHAGLFSNINSLCETLINIDKNHDLIATMMKEEFSRGRFIGGFDTVKDLENTLAGKGASLSTFGHLGFTGTSFWIDGEKKLGHVLLTNETKKYWYDRARLNELRRNLGQMVFN
ncbi:putative beta-lactamase [Bacteriovorax sp. BSW11_IV]|uniref:serine hydrolase n=1 Tax=Bacteriovorax sp. BSW11_IV TaxID=1353529 RepID=UPI00038A008B|nr:serine hydrolase [Bacteriovorax sp. BSW11_IV]EQC45850.1 putative beta-lactamase [Bacteriovorax sp. BSW11_IV]